jgi:hypothetical protein
MRATHAANQFTERDSTQGVVRSPGAPYQPAPGFPVRQPRRAPQRERRGVPVPVTRPERRRREISPARPARPAETDPTPQAI